MQAHFFDRWVNTPTIIRVAHHGGGAPQCHPSVPPDYHAQPAPQQYYNNAQPAPTYAPPALCPGERCATRSSSACPRTPRDAL
jgi:hypothetical protein